METGRLYTARDMARIYCEKCNGCGDCCHGMGDTIHLDPWDIHHLGSGLHKSFDEMLGREIALCEEEGLLVPYLLMAEDQKPSLRQYETPGVCSFLGPDGRCTIHSFRPGYCRLFPLGRNFDQDTHTFRYFIVENGCDMPGKMKMQISKWLGIPDLPRYEQYICDWHYFRKDVQKKIAASPDLAKPLNLFILKVFFQTPYGEEKNFYDTFYIRLNAAQSAL